MPPFEQATIIFCVLIYLLVHGELKHCLLHSVIFDIFKSLPILNSIFYIDEIHLVNIHVHITFTNEA